MKIHLHLATMLSACCLWVLALTPPAQAISSLNLVDKPFGKKNIIADSRLQFFRIGDIPVLAFDEFQLSALFTFGDAYFSNQLGGKIETHVDLGMVTLFANFDVTSFTHQMPKEEPQSLMFFRPLQFAAGIDVSIPILKNTRQVGLTYILFQDLEVDATQFVGTEMRFINHGGHDIAVWAAGWPTPDLTLADPSQGPLPILGRVKTGVIIYSPLGQEDLTRYGLNTTDYVYFDVLLKYYADLELNWYQTFAGNVTWNTAFQLRSSTDPIRVAYVPEGKNAVEFPALASRQETRLTLKTMLFYGNFPLGFKLDLSTTGRSFSVFSGLTVAISM